MTTALSALLRTDSYKTSHFLQYPPGTTRVSAYISARGGAYSETVFFGLQAFLRDYLARPVTAAEVDEAAAIFAAHGVPFNRAGWERIVAVHGGYLPVEIEAAPEGMVLPVGAVQVQVVNTDPELPWLTSYLETALLRAVWYPSTVATVSREMKKVIWQGLLQSSETPAAQIGFKLHDFGARGATSSEAAMLGGMAHLVNFQGTDTVEALIGARRFYDADMAGFSIPAAEHSTMTAWGREGETEAFRNMLRQFGGAGKVLAVVSDSYDIFHAVDHVWGETLRAEVEGTGGTLVVRPDSGDPAVMPVEVIERLMARFGHRVNAKGYRVLPDCVRVIQGDGIDRSSLPRIVATLLERGLSLDNLAFGMGAGLLQKLDRDTLRYAMKASAIEVAGTWRDIWKDPVTDQGKASRRGRLALIRSAGNGGTGIVTLRREAALPGQEHLLRPVYRNGELLNQTTLDAVRARAVV